VQVTVNGRNEELPAGSSVGALVERLGFGKARLAIELNKRIVEHGRWDEALLEEADNVEIVEFVGGG